MEQPFFGVLLMRLKVVEDSSCDTMWVDGARLGYNPAFVEEINDLKLRGTLCHEVMHVALGHCWREPVVTDFPIELIHEVWNEACDYTVNPMVKKAGLDLPEGALFDKDLEGSANENFVKLMKRLKDSAKQQSADQKKNQKQGGQGQPQAAQPGDQGNQASQQQSQQPGQQKGQPGQQQGQPGQPGQQQGSQAQAGTPSQQGSSGRGQPGQPGQDAGNGSQATPKRYGCGEVRQYQGDDVAVKEAEWQVAVIQAHKAAAMAGALPGGMEGLMEGYAESSVDWRSLLLRFAQDSTANDYNFARPNPRYLYLGLYQPSLREEAVSEFVVVRDSSGSVWSEIQTQFDAEIVKAFEDSRARRLVVMDCDTRVTQTQTFERGDSVELKPVRGGGGTAFIAPFIEVDKEGIDPAFLIYLTDMRGRFPDQEPRYPVLWASTTPLVKAPKPPFGELVYVNV